jgi:Putative metal-binding motif
MRISLLVLFMSSTVLLIFFSGCGCEDEAEDAIEELTGWKFEFEEEEIGVETPDGWVFLFGLEPKDGEYAEQLDSDFKVDLSFLEQSLSIDLTEITQMIAIAKLEDLDGYGNQLRYANKLIISDSKLQLDTETLDQLGDSIGSSGEGMYVAYYAEEQNGYIKGTIEDCDGDAIGDALAVITGGPFFTFSADDGSLALPNLTDTPAVITVFGGDCACVLGAPSTDTNQEENPKSPEDTPDSSLLDDGTYVVDAGSCVCCPAEPVPDCVDNDLDGYGEGADCLGADCDDTNSAIYQYLEGYVDVDGDGYTEGESMDLCSGAELPPGYSDTSLGEDCNDVTPAIYQYLEGYVDMDGDGYTVGDLETAICSGAELPSGYSDTSSGEDCEDEDVSAWQNLNGYVDADLDGHGDEDATEEQLCTGESLPVGYSTLNDDCDDSVPSVFTGADEIADNGVDEDCDGDDLHIVDCPDEDGDGYGNVLDVDCIGGLAGPVDCDDTNEFIFLMNDWYADADLDSYGAGDLTSVCSGNEAPAGYSDNNRDCDDGDDGLFRLYAGYTDADGDSYGAGDLDEAICGGENYPNNYVPDNNSDCDDTVAESYQYLSGYVDGDGDDYTIGELETLCTGATLPSGYVEEVSDVPDCDDADPEVNPGAEEIMDDGIDNDCNPETLDVERDPIDEDDGVLGWIDFEDGSLEGWTVHPSCELYGISNQAYQEMFPGGQQEKYLFLSTGGDNVKDCWMFIHADVPDGATEIEVKYSFVSQEYEEWLGSPYNDIFTVILQSSPDYIVNRTVNNTASNEDWLEIGPGDAAATMADIALSVDAQANAEFTEEGEPHSNGPNMFDGKLDYGEATGNPDEDNAGKISSMSLPVDKQHVKIVVSVSDISDRIYDSVGVIDWIRFK